MIKLPRLVFLLSIAIILSNSLLSQDTPPALINFEDFLEALHGEQGKIVVIHVMDVATANVNNSVLKNIIGNDKLITNPNVKIKYIFLPFERDQTLERAKNTMTRLQGKIDSANAEFYILDAPSRFDGRYPFKDSLAQSIHKDYDPKWTPFTIVVQSSTSTLYQVLNEKANTQDQLFDLLNTLK